MSDFKVDISALTSLAHGVGWNERDATVGMEHFIQGFVTKQRARITALEAELATAKLQFSEHTAHVQRFLQEMYATMIDPVEDGTGNVAETCQALLEAARRDRETEATAKERIAELMNAGGDAAVKCAELIRERDQLQKRIAELETEAKRRKLSHPLSCAGINELIDKIKETQQERDQAREEIAAAKDISRDWESITGRITEAFDTLGGSRGACQNYYERLDWIAAQVTQAREERDRCKTVVLLLEQKATVKYGWKPGGDTPLDVFIAQKLTDIEQHRDKLRAFAQNLADTPNIGNDVDGSDLQRLAVKHGLLAVETRTEPCTPADARGDHPGCSCGQFGFPAECYRKTPLLTGGV